MVIGEGRPGLALGPVLKVAVGVAGFMACLTLLFLGMRAVMDVGGMCAEGGPYQIAQACPQGSTAATLLGIFGMLGFGAIALWGASGLGGPVAILSVLGWSALFGSLGWNFLDYGLINPLPDVADLWGWVISGVLFEIMAIGPLVFAAWAIRAARPTGGQGPRTAFALPMPPGGLGRTAPGRASPSSPSSPPAGEGAAGAREGAGEGSAALLDRLERLADMRDRGLLSAGEFETAKRAVMDELEARA